MRRVVTKLCDIQSCNMFLLSWVAGLLARGHTLLSFRRTRLRRGDGGGSRRPWRHRLDGTFSNACASTCPGRHLAEWGKARRRWRAAASLLVRVDLRSSHPEGEAQANTLSMAEFTERLPRRTEGHRGAEPSADGYAWGRADRWGTDEGAPDRHPQASEAHGGEGRLAVVLGQQCAELSNVAVECR